MGSFVYVSDNLPPAFGPVFCLVPSKSRPFILDAPTLALLLPSLPLGGTFVEVRPTDDDSCPPDSLVLARLIVVGALEGGFEACITWEVSGFEVRMSFMREKASSILLARNTLS